MSDTRTWIPDPKKGICGLCGKTRGMHHFVVEPKLDGGENRVVYCTPPKRGDEPVHIEPDDPDLKVLWEPTPSQCSSCGHVTSNGGLYLYKVNEKYRYCMWCVKRGGRGNVLRLILVRALADQECEDPRYGLAAETVEPREGCRCFPCLARKLVEHPFA